MNDIYKKYLCNYLINKDLVNITMENNENNVIKKITFRKDEDKNLLYSKVYSSNNTELDFIYKLSSEIEKCRNN